MPKKKAAVGETETSWAVAVCVSLPAVTLAEWDISWDAEKRACHRGAGREARRGKKKKKERWAEIRGVSFLWREIGGWEESRDRESPPLVDLEERQEQTRGLIFSLSLSVLLLCCFHCVCVEKMSSQWGMCESGGGGVSGLDEEEGRISCSHSPCFNHRK